MLDGGRVPRTALPAPVHDRLNTGAESRCRGVEPRPSPDLWKQWPLSAARARLLGHEGGSPPHRRTRPIFEGQVDQTGIVQQERRLTSEMSACRSALATAAHRALPRATQHPLLRGNLETACARPSRWSLNASSRPSAAKSVSRLVDLSRRTIVPRGGSGTQHGRGRRCPDAPSPMSMRRSGNRAHAHVIDAPAPGLRRRRLPPICIVYR